MPDVAAEPAPPTGSPHSDVWRAVVVVLVAIIAVVATRAAQRGSPRPERAQCARLLERWSTEAFRQRNPDARTETVTQFANQAVRDSGEAAQLDACQSHLSARQVSCALAASNVDEMERCVQ